VERFTAERAATVMLRALYLARALRSLFAWPSIEESCVHVRVLLAALTECRLPYPAGPPGSPFKHVFLREHVPGRCVGGLRFALLPPFVVDHHPLSSSFSPSFTPLETIENVNE